MNDFVHLHVHSEYSLLDGAARIEALADRASRLGMRALALTDHGVMYGAIPFYKACVSRGIKPIIGCEFYYTSDSLKAKGARGDIYHLVLLAENLQGYRNIMKLCSIAHLEGFHYKPRIDMHHLKEHAEGVICLSACLKGEVAQHLLHGRREEALRAAERYRDVFADRFYLELQDHGLLEQKKVNAALIELSRETGIPLVATNDVHYVTAEDSTLQDILLCIGTGKTVDDPNRMKMVTDQNYLKSGAEMASLFPHVPEALANTAQIAERCNLELEFGRPVLPKFAPLPEGLTAGGYLRRLCADGLRRRYEHSGRWQDPDLRRELEERLDYELGVIDNMGFSDYFLIVWDFVRFARERGIAVGPGRGSAAGSLVAYTLFITDVDPLEYHLLFERFLNPERVSMPDIDIDFSDERRDEVIAYVVNKYGAEHVAQIITFGTMAARAAVRDVGRVLNLPYGEVDRAAKMIPHQLGITLDKAIAANPDLQKLIAADPGTAKLIDMAKKVEGMPRHASTHAAGVVISREPLTDYVPLQEGAEGTPLTQYTMEHLEAIGLLKMDFLGLRTLSIIERTVRWVRDLYGVELDFARIGYDDEATYRLLSRGETAGVFQLESAGCQRVLKELKPSEFADIVSVVALYRPGPMDFIPKFIQGKHGMIEVEYPHPDLEPILKDTYGIIVYQEQIMQIASRMAGFSLGEADLLRRAVGKKKREVLAEERTHFVDGCLRQGYSEEDAHKVYDMIVRFADYGFCRAHATAYGVLAYQTAYLKANYPVAFMASMMTAVMGNHRKVAEYVDECRRMHIAVLPPDINESGIDFTPVADGASSEANGDASSGADGGEARGLRGSIRFGLAAVKNVGTQAIEAILHERKERPFTDLFDFCSRVDLRVCNKRVVESLIQGGAMDSLPGHRAQLIAMLEETIDKALKWKKERDDLQLHLFGFTEEANASVEYPDVKPYGKMQQLEMERELLGMYLSGHPLEQYESWLQSAGADPLHRLGELPEGSDVLTAGRIVGVKTIVTKKGQPMSFLELEDRIEKTELVVFPELWKSAGDFMQKGALLLVRAKLKFGDEGEAKLLAEQACPLDDETARERLLRIGRTVRRDGDRPAAGAAVRAGFAAEDGADRTAKLQAAVTANRQRAVRAAGPPQAPRAVSRPRVKTQRLFVKIAADRENPALLGRLQSLLQGQPGVLPVVLFYEREQKTIALNGQYNVKPSPELIRGIERLMGPGTARIK